METDLDQDRTAWLMVTVSATGAPEEIHARTMDALRDRMQPELYLS